MSRSQAKARGNKRHRGRPFARARSFAPEYTVAVIAPGAPREQYLRALPYLEYLKTGHWRRLRARALLRWAGACENCGVAAATQVHHRTYERLGAERLEDLQPLCNECHALEHDQLAHRRRNAPLG